MTIFQLGSRWRLVSATVAIAAGMAACGGGGSSGSGFFFPPTANAPASPVVTAPETPVVSAPGTPTIDTPELPVVEPEAVVTRKWGYITLPDGNKMRYSLLLPNSTGSFPVLVEYDGYSAGNDPDAMVPVIAKRWVKEGYAVLGLNVPGTGCSTGEDQVFDASTGEAGAFAIEWAGKQAWSNGRIGMIGYSYSGYNQLWVAAHRPKGLLAITPGKNVADPYRDIGHPGGIPNLGFPVRWWSGFPYIWSVAADLALKLDGDTECAKTVADNIEKIKRPELDLVQWLANTYADGLYLKRSAMYETAKINIPTLGTQSWQDEQIGPRAGYYEDTIAADKMWLVSSNGDHHTNITSDAIDETLKRFLAHFVKGEENGFEREPHVRLMQEMQTLSEKALNGGLKIKPNAIAQFDRLPVAVQPMRLWMQPGGLLSDAKPTGESLPSAYDYPVASPVVNNPDAEGWQAVDAVGQKGQLTFTTAPLPDALSFYGEGSADLWLSSTVDDTDVQVTVSEVRPDGQEMYVQRGWLRASKSALDESRSKILRPWGAFTRDTQRKLEPGVPTAVRIEIQKFAHVFRKGSSIRVTIDSPSQTGYWLFDKNKTASRNSLLHDPLHASSIALGYIGYPHAQALPSCDKTIRQPCRPNKVDVPTGVGPTAPI